MLAFRRKKKKLLVFSAIFVLMLPIAGIVAGKIIESNNSFATEYEYPIPAGYTTIVDQNFYECVAKELKREFSSEVIPVSGITDKQLGKIKALYCSGLNKTDAEKIIDATGIKKMVSLEYLTMQGNSLTSLDLSEMESLRRVHVDRNNIVSLNISKNQTIEEITANDNQLTSLNVSGDIALVKLQLCDNQLSSINILSNKALEYLSICKNRLSSLSISENIALKEVIAYENQLTSLDMANNKNLAYLSVQNNQLTSLDVSEATALEKLAAFSNELNWLDLSNNPKLDFLSLDNIPIRVNLEIVSTDPVAFSLSNLSFLDFSRQIINDTNDYTYDSENNIVIMNNSNRYNNIQVGSNSYKIELPYVLVLDPNGGTGGAESDYCYSILDSCDVTIPDTSNSPTRSGYRFIGYADSADADIPQYQLGETITLTENKTIYAVWVPIYTLTLSPNAGTYPDGAPTTLTCAPTTINGGCNTTIPSSSNNPTRSGYVFQGYAESASATAAQGHPGQVVYLDNNKTIYAVWKKMVNIYTSVSGNGGTITESKENVAEGTKHIIYFYPEEGYELDEVTVNGVIVEVNDNRLSVKASKEDIYIVAKFKLPAYTLTLDPNGGEYPVGATTTLNCSPTTVNGGCSVVIPDSSNNPTRSGYEFQGYAETNDATTPQGGGGPGQAVYLDADRTLYAIWSRKIGVYASVSGIGGTISVSGRTYNAVSNTANDGTKVLMLFNPEAGYELDTVTVNSDIREITNNRLSLTLAGEDVYVVATFKRTADNPEFNPYEYLVNNYSVGGTNKYMDLTSLRQNVNDIEALFNNTTYTVNIDTKTVNDNRVLYTGGKIKFYNNNNLIDTYTIVIKGDLTGYGKIDSMDILRMRQHLLGMTILIGPYYLAGDITQNGNIDSMDLLRLRQHLLGTKPIN